MLPIKRSSVVPSLINRDEFLTPFSDLFDNFFNDSFDFLGKDFFEKGTYPKVDIRNENTQLVIEAEVPGLNKDQISVEIDGNVLRIKGEKKNNDETKTRTYVHRELKHSSFCRSFLIPETVDVEKLTAKFENGILEIDIPKKVIEPVQPNIRKVKIE